MSKGPTEEVSQLRESYSTGGLPTHPKKSVEQALTAEVQGAWVDGDLGLMCAKPSKIAKYCQLALVSMFRRPLLGSLNQLWQTITSLEGLPGHQSVPLRRELMIELVRFLGLIPLAFSNLRAKFDETVTVSDASSSGGGFCASRGLTPYGLAAAASPVRGDLPEPHDFCQILTIGLFDGIGALRVAMDLLEAPVAGHISAECNPQANRVLEANFADVIVVEDIGQIDEEMVRQWSLRFSGVGLILIGSGPPRQGVSGLNPDRRGALRDARSSLYWHVPRVGELCKRSFPWAQVQSLTENVSSMDYEDCQVMNEEYLCQPWYTEASGVSLANRPRLYWLSWELIEGDGVQLLWGSSGRLPICGEVVLQAEVDEKKFLEAGWKLQEGRKLPTFTTSRCSVKPPRKPAGVHHCREHELDQWRADWHRYPPYQYRGENCLQRGREFRTPSVLEREVILGFPSEYTLQCMRKRDHGTSQHEDCRLSLLGNTWSVPVGAWLLSTLLTRLGLIDPISLQEIVNRATPGGSRSLQGMLLRPPLHQGTSTYSPSAILVQKLAGLGGGKGEDLVLQPKSEVPVRYQRMRISVPSRLWRWKIIAGWSWRGDPEHINVLEARASMTSLRWRIEQLQQLDVRCVHLVDSLVVLHCFT